MDQARREEAVAAIEGAHLTWMELEDTEYGCAFERFSESPWYLNYDDEEAPNSWSIEDDTGDELVFAATAVEAFTKLDTLEMGG